jgi:hypothetical protein
MGSVTINVDIDASSSSPSMEPLAPIAFARLAEEVGLREDGLVSLAAPE